MNLGSGIGGVLLLIAVIYAIVSIASSSATSGAKALWIVLVIVLPLVGFIIWLLLGPKK
ncbi:PLDc N-terminal domain-containing protein [Polycyclovorans algicola]|uniref:PLDc N-terminal domain-containing protein n=1 Tax=Polycyclovorans algicola TaxID=616992 RepID=UPI000A00B9BD|nr:PLDc N-terminal domain-containing protein [Polycyclovorans algicola]